MTERSEALAELLGPMISDENGRSLVTGKFLPGNTIEGRGRPRGYDFRTILAEMMDRTGRSAADLVEEIVEALRINSILGDTAASKILLDRICGKEAEALDLNVNARQMTDTEREARLRSIFADADRRRAARRITVTEATAKDRAAHNGGPREVKR